MQAKSTKTLLAFTAVAAVAVAGHATAASQAGSLAGDRYGHEFRTGKFDPFSEGARTGKFDPYTEGARTGKFDPYTEGARI